MRILFILCFFIGITATAQDYFVKTVSESFFSGESIIAATPDGGVIHTNGFYNINAVNKGLLVRRLSKCGDELWLKKITHPTDRMDIIGIQVDTNGNYIISGNLGFFNSGARPYLLSIGLDGNVNYFKSIDMPSKVESKVYSFAENDDFYLYFNYDTTGTNKNLLSVIKLDVDGKLISFKSFDGLNGEGKAIATKDKGLLFQAGKNIIKTNPDGTVSWSKRYDNMGSMHYPIQVEGGYIFFTNSIGFNYNIVKIDNQGEFVWMTNFVNSFRPGGGVLRKNGNVLYSGSGFSINNTRTLIEIDTSSGSIIRFKGIESPTGLIRSGRDLIEGERGDILINMLGLGIIGFIRVDSTLDLINCSTTNLQLSNTKPPSIVVTSDITTSINQSNQLLTITDETYFDTVLTITRPTVECSFQRDRGILELEKDTILCPEEILAIGNTSSTFDDYLWSTGAKTKQIVISSAGTYSIRVIAACDTLRDTINIDYYPNVDLFIGEDSSICLGDSLVLKSKFSLSNYLWSTGENTAEITVKDAGTYWLETTTVCGKVRDSIVITVLPLSGKLDLGKDTSICLGAEINLGDSLSDFDHFSWSTGENTQFITVKDSGLYIVEATTLCDTLKDSIRVLLNPELNVSFSMDKEVVKTFEDIQLIRNERNGVAVEWDFGDGAKVIGDTAVYQYPLAGDYTIQLIITSAEGCQFIAEQQITIQPSDYSIPNVFSPNNDGINDEFKPLGKDIKSYRLRIYDRWGKEIFSKRNITWDGRNKDGRKMNAGVYFYVITLYWNHGGNVELDGNFSLLR